ncbi:MAG: type II/IV secretion system ATPase subunit [Euryarchaeota archaeon]|nr:type II/IV secretion system ATPase subunit [Euryarchaeota archaeon]
MADSTPDGAPPRAVFRGLEGWEEVERYWVVEPDVLAVVLHHPGTRERCYHLVEPELSPLESEMLEVLYDDLRERLPLEAVEPGERSLEGALGGLLEEYRVELPEDSRKKVFYYLRREFLGFEKLDGLMRDPGVEDISCNGAGVPVYIYHRRHQNLRTNVAFEEADLDSLVARLAQRAGRHISLGFPLLQATLPDGSRLQASLGREVTSRGSSFTIRRFHAEPLTPVDLITGGTASAEMMAYMWMAVEHGKSFLLAGGTASGKTTTLNATMLFLPPESKVVSIEDTREITLQHDNWVAGVTREQGGEPIGMFELLRQALRQRPEFLLVGEVRGKEAQTLFQAMSTGHTTYSTLHASTVQEVISRLENEPMNVAPMMLLSLQGVGVQVLTQSGGMRVRRLQSLTEVTGMEMETGNFRVNEVYRWDPAKDRFARAGESQVLRGIMEEMGWSREQMEQELSRRTRMLERMVERNIRGYREFTEVVRTYYRAPEDALKRLG